MRTFALCVAIAGTLLSSGCLMPQRFCGDGPGCGLGACNQCDDCGTPPIPCTPWEHFRQRCGLLHCGSGCGDVYYGEWLSYPPDCQDPCDQCGQWVGSDGCKCLPLSRFDGLLAGLWGRRLHCDDTCGFFDCMSGACDICQNAPCSCGGCDSGGEIYEGEVYADEVYEGSVGGTWSEGEIIESGAPLSPTPAPQREVQPAPRLNTPPANGAVAPPKMRSTRSIRSQPHTARQPQKSGNTTPPISIRR